ncbi:DUF2199 domain-containing protein [Bradyrhizobium sp. USDA 241]|uniref:DUF2199 domain-containing protein n=1 Tax=Bradyrhizobium sp. USDA 241 TaxID=3377725 RepID=UPI003C776669
MLQCTCCDEWHEEMPGYSAEAPLYLHSIPAVERDRRCALDADTCIVDEEFYFARGCLEIRKRYERPTEPRTWCGRPTHRA